MGPEMRSIRGAEMSMIFQEPMTSLNPSYTIGDQIMEAIILHQKVDKAEAEKRAITILDGVGMANPQAGGQALPARAERWHAPAGDDLPGAFLHPLRPVRR